MLNVVLINPRSALLIAITSELLFCSVGLLRLLLIVIKSAFISLLTVRIVQFETLPVNVLVNELSEFDIVKIKGYTEELNVESDSKSVD